MLQDLLDEEALICPRCRGWRQGDFFMSALRWDVRGDLLACPACGARYPVIDDVAVIVTDPAEWLRQQERAVLWRADLSPHLDRWIRGAWDEDADPNWHRQMLAVYSRQLTPIEDDDPLAALRKANRDVHRTHQHRIVQAGAQRVIDAGCGVGNAALSLAALGASVLAVDHSFAGLRQLSRLLRDGTVHAPRWRHGGDDYTTVTVTLPETVDPKRIALIAADMTDPPLRARSADAVFAYNLVDNVAKPVLLLQQLHALLKVGGTLALTSPYDWSPRATPRQERLMAPDPAQAVVALLQGQRPELAPEMAMEIVEQKTQPWVLRRHQRSAHVFDSHYVEAVRREPGGSPIKNR
ncbi:MAG: methyltransferase domain-containing protein [Myxococcota bacterium]